MLTLRSACNHPSLVSHDYQKDKEAVAPKAANTEKDLADDANDEELADLMGGMGLAGIKRCQMCQRTYVTAILVES